MSFDGIDFESLDALVASGTELPKYVARIKARCEECGDCWMWKGSLDRNAIPKINVGGTPRSARRIVHEHFHGPVRSGYEVKAKCRNQRCVSPNCSGVFSRSASMKIAAEGRISSAAQIAAARRRGKLTEMSAAEIRCSELSNEKLALIYGVTKKTVWSVKRGFAWKTANPFAGLGSRG